METGLDTGAASAEDASRLLAENQLSLDILKRKFTSIHKREYKFGALASTVYRPGLFLGIMAYLFASVRRAHIACRRGGEA